MVVVLSFKATNTGYPKKHTQGSTGTVALTSKFAPSAGQKTHGDQERRDSFSLDSVAKSWVLMLLLKGQGT